MAEAQRSPAGSIEVIHLALREIAGCLGCNYCQQNNGVCVQKDDMMEIREKMTAADVIVLVSPIYFYSMTGQMKTMLDRAYAFFTQLAGKTFYYIITCAAPEESFSETMLASLRGFTCCVPDSVEDGVVLGLGAKESGDIFLSPAMEQAYEMGRRVSENDT